MSFFFSSFTAFVSMKCKTRLAVQSGQESLLECVLKTSKEVKGLIIRNVIWKNKNGVVLLDYDEGNTTKRPGYSFAEPSWNDRTMNVSLLISHTTVQHQGIYRCQVHTSSGPADDRIYLEVAGKQLWPVTTFLAAV